jgi:hypothetical protein
MTGAHRADRARRVSNIPPRRPGNTAVLTYSDVQQLFNNWGNGGFNGAQDTPISGLAGLTSSTIDVLDGLHYFQSKGVVASNATISQVKFGSEIWSTSGRAETFNVTDYSLTATPRWATSGRRHVGSVALTTQRSTPS